MEAAGDLFSGALVSHSEAAVREALAAALAARGATRVRVAVSDEEAHHELVASPPALVFAGWRDAPDAPSRLSEILDRVPDAPVVLVTDEPPSSPVVRKAVRAGAFAVLHTPLQAEALRRVLDEVAAEQVDELAP